MKVYNNKFSSIFLRPSVMQFVIDEFPLLLLCPIGLLIAGMDEIPLSSLIALLSLFIFLVLVYRFIYLKKIRYHIEQEQLVYEHGVFQRSVEYVELYRVIDFNERQSLPQQVFGLKTVIIYSGDKTTPKLDMIGVPVENEIVDIVRERVEYNKQRRGVYEITNR